MSSTSKGNIPSIANLMHHKIQQSQEEAENLATAHPSRAMEVLVPFDDLSVEWEELKHTLQGCEDSLMVASRLQSFIQVQKSVQHD